VSSSLFGAQVRPCEAAELAMFRFFAEAMFGGALVLRRWTAGRRLVCLSRVVNLGGPLGDAKTEAQSVLQGVVYSGEAKPSVP
jgi:hypothetical protein